MFQQTRHGVSLQSSLWKKVYYSNNEYHSDAWVRLAGLSTNDVEPLGFVRIKRRRTTVKGRRVFEPFFRATFTSHEDFGKPVTYALGMGRARTWEEAVKCVNEGFDVVSVIAEHGKTVYDRDLWRPVRPFRVKYPWVDPEEPNAKYTSFSLCGPWSIEAGMEGVVYQFAPTVHTMAELAKRFHANALLVRDDDGNWEVYHRHNMTTGDPIEIEDFYGRILAGQDDNL